MSIRERLKNIWKDTDTPFLISDNQALKFSTVINHSLLDLSEIQQGDVVALVGDFNATTILTLLTLIDRNAIIVPMTKNNIMDQEYFLDVAMVDYVIDGSFISKRSHDNKSLLLEHLRQERHAGLILFSTGTTGSPKAILHDLTLLTKRFEKPRPSLRTLSFLLFDHIGGVNTLLHTLFNKGVLISPEVRTVKSILDVCRDFSVELLPTTPTFLRMMLMSGEIPDSVPECLKIITYGTERMDEFTLSNICKLLPNVDFRQTYGMSELGILRVKSLARDSLLMKIGGEGIETKISNGTLYIRSETRMLGYLNANSPFDSDGWYDTRDIVEEHNGFYRVIGRSSDIINVGGLKFHASDVEDVVIRHKGVSFAKVVAKSNPITGQHVELIVQEDKLFALNKISLISFLNEKLPPHMRPRKVIFKDVEIGYRFKKS